MSNPTEAMTPRQAGIDGHALLRWCGYAACVGLFAGVGIGIAILFR